MLNIAGGWLSGNALASINVVALRQTRLVPRWVTVCGRVNHLGSRYVTSQLQANSAFHPYEVDKSSTNLPDWGEGGAVTSVGWQITM